MYPRVQQGFMDQQITKRGNIEGIFRFSTDAFPERDPRYQVARNLRAPDRRTRSDCADRKYADRWGGDGSARPWFSANQRHAVSLCADSGDAARWHIASR